MRRCPFVLVGLIIALVSFPPLIISAQTVVEPVMAGPVSGNKPAIPENTAPPERNIDRDKLRIGAGDLLDVSVYGVSDFKQDGRISESGEITLPLIGSINLGGLTTDEAQTKVAKALVAGGFFRDPHVMVLIKDYTSQGISVMGEVDKPGVYPAVNTRRLYDLISQAGGFIPKAGKLVTVTHRDNPTVPDNIILTNDPAKSMASNVAIYPGDTIVVA